MDHVETKEINHNKFNYFSHLSNNRFFRMHLGSDVKDVAISIADEYGTDNIRGLKFGDTVLLEAWRDGNDKDGRIYTITAVVTDQAGNRTTKATTVAMIHDMGK